MIGKRRIGESSAGICGADLDVAIADEVMGANRVAFSMDVTLPDGRRVLEHAIAHLEGGKVVRQVDVEAWG